MRISELLEAENNSHATFCFGRMNPPTVGHRQLLDTMAGVGGDMFIFLSKTQDQKKNPLDFTTKINFVKKMFPEYAGNIVEDGDLNVFHKCCDYLYKQGYRHVTLVAGEDRLESMSKILHDYNGVEGKGHGFYKFETIDSKSSGSRDPDGDGISSVSASAARAAAANNEFEKFEQITGAGQFAEDLYKAVRQGMGIKNES